MVEPKSGLTRPVPDFFGDIWRLGSGAPASLILLFLLMATLALCAAFPQQPAGLSGSSAEQWLMATAADYHALGPILRFLSIYNISGGLWLRMLLGAIAYHLLLRAARTGLRAWGALRPADMLHSLPPAFLPAEFVTLPVEQPQLQKSAAQAEASGRTAGLQQKTQGREAPSLRREAPVEPQGDLRERIQVALETRLGYRCHVLVRTPVWSVLYGVRRNWAVLAPVGTCAGGLLLLIGLLLNNIGGWTASGLALARDIPTEVPQAGGLIARLEAVNGADSNPTSSVLLTWPGGVTARASVGYVHPAWSNGLWLVQQSTGAGLAVSAQDEGGHPILLQSVTGPQTATAGPSQADTVLAQSDDGQPATPRAYVGDTLHVLFTATQTEQVFATLANDTAFRVVDYPALPERGIAATVFLVEAYHGNDPTPALSQLVSGQATLTLDRITYHFQEDRHAVMDLSYLPGAAPLALGALLTLAGITISLWWGRSEVWISLMPREPGTLAFLRSRSAPGDEARRHGFEALRVALGEDPSPSRDAPSKSNVSQPRRDATL